MNEYIEINKVPKNMIVIFDMFKNNKNNKHVINEAIVPGANFIFPTLKKVIKNKLNFLIIFRY